MFCQLLWGHFLSGHVVGFAVCTLHIHGFEQTNFGYVVFSASCSRLLQEVSRASSFLDCIHSTTRAVDPVQVGSVFGELVRQWPALHHLHPVV